MPASDSESETDEEPLLYDNVSSTEKSVVKNRCMSKDNDFACISDDVDKAVPAPSTQAEVKPLGGAGELVDSLLRSGELLESKANQLERKGQHHRADRYRALAQFLRAEARLTAGVPSGR